MSILKQIWFWALLAGFAAGVFVSYQLGWMQGYDHTIGVLRDLIHR